MASDQGCRLLLKNTLHTLYCPANPQVGDYLERGGPPPEFLAKQAALSAAAAGQAAEAASKKKVIVIGAGPAGLTAASHLQVINLADEAGQVPSTLGIWMCMGVLATARKSLKNTLMSFSCEA